MNNYNIDDDLLNELYFKVRALEMQYFQAGEDSDSYICKKIIKEIEKTVLKEEKNNEISTN